MMAAQVLQMDKDQNDSRITLIFPEGEIISCKYSDQMSLIKANCSDYAVLVVFLAHEDSHRPFLLKASWKKDFQDIIDALWCSELVAKKRELCIWPSREPVEDSTLQESRHLRMLVHVGGRENHLPILIFALNLDSDDPDSQGTAKSANSKRLRRNFRPSRIQHIDATFFKLRMNLTDEVLDPLHAVYMYEKEYAAGTWCAKFDAKSTATLKDLVTLVRSCTGRTITAFHNHLNEVIAQGVPMPAVPMPQVMARAASPTPGTHLIVFFRKDPWLLL